MIMVIEIISWDIHEDNMLYNRVVETHYDRDWMFYHKIEIDCARQATSVQEISHKEFKSILKEYDILYIRDWHITIDLTREVNCN